jgi:pyruvate/2-oxoglutarate dehydrogenase complex dihydrolipoamide dehydrogenase (E3) component
MLPGLDRIPFLDNASVMDLPQLPEHLVVLGGGYIACEFGQMFRRFGVPVSIVHRGEHLLSREDPDVAQALEEVFRREGIELFLNAAARQVEPEGSGLRLDLADGRTVRGSHLLVATGRHPNTDDLGCEAGGIERGERGEIVVDDHYKTSADGVFAVGDVIGGPQFTHTSWDDHRLLFDVLAGREVRSRHDRLIPYSIFTDPPLARVGLSETEAQQRGISYERARLPYERIARAIEVDETAGLMKLLIDPATEKILGATLVGLDAGELIHIFVALMQAGSSARPLAEAQAVHPTLAEGVQSLVMSLKRYALI